jgi:hypothetical protein
MATGKWMMPILAAGVLVLMLCISAMNVTQDGRDDRYCARLYGEDYPALRLQCLAEARQGR